MKCAAAKGAIIKGRRRPQNTILYQETRFVSEKEMRIAIKAHLLQSFSNAKMKEWGNIAIKVALTLKTRRQTVMHAIEDVMNDRYGKAQEGMKELETS